MCACDPAFRGAPGANGDRSRIKRTPSGAPDGHPYRKRLSYIPQLDCKLNAYIPRALRGRKATHNSARDAAPRERVDVDTAHRPARKGRMSQKYSQMVQNFHRQHTSAQQTVDPTRPPPAHAYITHVHGRTRDVGRARTTPSPQVQRLLSHKQANQHQTKPPPSTQAHARSATPKPERTRVEHSQCHS